LSDFQSSSPFSAKYFEMQDEKSRRELLHWSYWGLHAPFTVGILNGCRGNTVLHDGNEDAYYYTSALEFYRIITQLRTLGRQMIPAASRPAFDRHYKVGHAVSVDYTAGNWAEAINFPNDLRQQALQLSEQERAEWFEHNLYHALASSDQFVWVYSEKPSFWKQTDVPPGFNVAFELAVAKYRQGKPLGFSIEAKLEAARARIKARGN
ncbi:MAG TPA: hypothetical protein PKA06_15130, partial [Gemmatales bacterium]|nr:hypothetical protein [Gemmatales bacterium]